MVSFFSYFLSFLAILIPGNVYLLVWIAYLVSTVGCISQLLWNGKWLIGNSAVMSRTPWTLHFALCDSKLSAVPVSLLTHFTIPAVRKQRDCFHSPFSGKDDQFFIKVQIMILSFLSFEGRGHVGNYNVVTSSCVRLKGDAWFCIARMCLLMGVGWAEGPNSKTHWAGGTGEKGMGWSNQLEKDVAQRISISGHSGSAKILVLSSRLFPVLFCVGITGSQELIVARIWTRACLGILYLRMAKWRYPLMM